MTLVDGLLAAVRGRQRRAPGRGRSSCGTAQVRPWRYPPVVDLQYGEWLRAGLEVGGRSAAGPDARPRAAAERGAGRRTARCRGPRLRDLVDPVPAGDLLRATRRRPCPTCSTSLAGRRAQRRPDAGAGVGHRGDRADPGQGRGGRLGARTGDAGAAAAAGARPAPLPHSSYADESWPAGVLEQVPALVGRARRADRPGVGVLPTLNGHEKAPRAPGRAHLPLLPSGPGGVQ